MTASLQRREANSTVSRNIPRSALVNERRDTPSVATPTVARIPRGASKLCRANIHVIWHVTSFLAGAKILLTLLHAYVSLCTMQAAYVRNKR